MSFCEKSGNLFWRFSQNQESDASKCPEFAGGQAERLVEGNLGRSLTQNTRFRRHFWALCAYDTLWHRIGRGGGETHLF